MFKDNFLKGTKSKIRSILYFNSKRFHKRAFIVAETCLQSCCLGTKGGTHFIEHLPSNDRRNTHTEIQTDEC
jgi:hypothetical protein